MTQAPFTVGLVQEAVTADKDANLARATQRIREAASRGAQIICLQELFNAPYFCKVQDAERFDLAEPIPGPTVAAMQSLARELGTVIIVPIFERQAAGVYRNSAVVIDADGTVMGTYRKMHIPDDPLFYEKFYFTPGDLGFQAWKTRFAKIGVCVCWDQWYPEAARLTALRGAEIIFYPTAIGWHPAEKSKFGQRQHDSWETIQRSHAIANGCYVAVPNRVGHEAPDGGEGIEFWGQSFVADPAGQVIGKAAPGEEEILIVEIDLESVETQRTHWPFFRDRRIDAYGDLEKRFID